MNILLLQSSRNKVHFTFFLPIISLFILVQVISVKLIKDKNTKMNAGYGFVEFGDHLTASHVLNTFNGAKIPGTLKSNIIFVNQLKYRTMRLNWGMFGGGLKPATASPAALAPIANTVVS